MEVRGRRCREISPEREKNRASVHVQQQGKGRVIKPPPTFKKVQVVYYLSKNGQLEHPHFMEVTHLAHQHLRLKDVMDRLTVLRGRSMPSLYSWSYKRSYKNGYVWNDLAENDDIISPSEGAEYVLKGSELIDNCTEKFQHPQFQVVLPDPTSLQPKRKLVPPKRHPEPEEFDNSNRYEHEDELNGNQEEEEEEEEFEEKTTSYTAPNTPYSRCSIGVSTDEIELELQRQEDDRTTHKHRTTDLTLENSSPPSATSSTIFDKATNDTSKRFEDGDPVGNESVLLSRNSVLYNLIACGGSVSFRGKSKVPVFKEQEVAVARKSGSLHKGVLCKSAVAAEKVVVVVAAGEEDEIKCMSENPRFGNLQAEEKEYFSGSIEEAISEDERVKGEPGLKKSSSYNEERSSKSGLGMGEEEEEVKRREKGAKGKCISISKKSSSSSSSSSSYSSSCFSYL